ncbi:hypothetical protein [Dysgonomonas sp. Marseille-P4361]|uniref:hypothetical protein n=1 Tax=Dysgonomonas sp. Marseille-P4361 TaxID=2161820 RepID=UPI00135C572C|nr:hypothetical protein [Dysgonomonas sp. Marseille-P4361]
MEALFIGALIGIVMYVVVSLDSKASEKRRNKEIKYLIENVQNKGGLPVLLNRLFDYLHNTLGKLEVADGRSVLSAINEKYEVTFMLYGKHYNTMSISIRNKRKDKVKEWEFELSYPQEKMIEDIDLGVRTKNLLD